MVNKVFKFRFKRLFKYTGAFIMACIVAYMFQLLWTLDKSINVYIGAVMGIILFYIIFTATDVALYLYRKYLSSSKNRYKRVKRELFYQYALKYFYSDQKVKQISNNKNIEFYNSSETGKILYGMSGTATYNLRLFMDFSDLAKRRTILVAKNYLKKKARRYGNHNEYKREGGKGTAIVDAYRIYDKIVATRQLKYYKVALKQIYDKVKQANLYYKKHSIKYIDKDRKFIVREMPYINSSGQLFIYKHRDYYNQDRFCTKERHFAKIEPFRPKEVNWIPFRFLNTFINRFLFYCKNNWLFYRLRPLLYTRDRNILETLIYIIFLVPLIIRLHSETIFRALKTIYYKIFRPIRVLIYVYKHIKPLYEQLLPLSPEQRRLYRLTLIKLNSIKTIKRMNESFIHFNNRTNGFNKLKDYKTKTIYAYFINDITLIYKNINNFIKILYKIIIISKKHIIKNTKKTIINIPKIPKLIKYYSIYSIWYCITYFTIRIPYAIKTIIKINKNYIINKKKKTKEIIEDIKFYYPEIDRTIFELKFEYYTIKFTITDKIEAEINKLKKKKYNDIIKDIKTILNKTKDKIINSNTTQNTIQKINKIKKKIIKTYHKIKKLDNKDKIIKEIKKTNNKIKKKIKKKIKYRKQRIKRLITILKTP